MYFIQSNLHSVDLHHFLDPSFLTFRGQVFLCSVTAGTPAPQRQTQRAHRFCL